MVELVKLFDLSQELNNKSEKFIKVRFCDVCKIKCPDLPLSKKVKYPICKDCFNKTFNQAVE